MTQPMKENFLRRWSRLKRDPPTPKDVAAAAPQQPAGASGAAPAAEPLPTLESLDFSSDFSVFMAHEVEDGLRRAALQKLFHAKHFNVMDGLDVYIDDYNSFEPIGEELLNNLNQARGLLFDDPSEALEVAEAAPAEAGPSRIDAVLPDESTTREHNALDRKP